MAKSTKAASKAAKAPTKASKAATKAGTAKSGRSSKSASKASKASKSSKSTTKASSSKATSSKGSTTTTKARTTRGKRLAPEANAQMKRIEALVIEVAERLEHLRSRYAELEDIEPDVGAGEDEGGASFDAGLVERDQIRSMIADEELIMQRLGDAAERVRSGTWRTCRVCKNDIGGPRLEALPGTDLCVSCKAAGH